MNCVGKCTCENGGVCNPLNGSCFCTDGWLGDHCEQRACAPSYYGPNCKKLCLCANETTELCHPWTGQCECRPGWDGQYCDRPCSLLKYGKGCRNQCQCLNNALCSPMNGKFVKFRFGLIWFVLFIRIIVLGTCLCGPGYRGERFELECPKGWFGVGCSQECECRNGATCLTEFGACNCTIG